MTSIRNLVIAFGVVVLFCGFTCGWQGLGKKDDAFHTAVFRGDLLETKRYLDAGKHPDDPGLDPRDGSALYGTLVMKDYKMADLLIAYGAKVNHVQWGQPLIYHMVKEGNRDGYVWLVKHGAKPNAATLGLLRSPSYKEFSQFVRDLESARSRSLTNSPP